MDWLLEKILLHPKWSMAIGGALLVVAGSIVLWQFIWQSPQAVFEDMLARNLSTMSVAKHVAAGKGDQSIDQLIRLELGGTNAANWLVTAKQTGSTVATESIGTPTTGYVRYTKIASTQKDAQGKTFDFSRVLNSWGKSDGKTDTSLDRLFSQTLLDITSAPTPPIANLTADKRAALLRYMREEKVFTPDYAKMKHETVDGRQAYAYSVSVKLGAYVRLMQAFAADMGLTSLKTVDPTQYDALNPITITMWVDPVSHQLVQLSYAGSGFTEHYSDWGLLTPIKLPTKTMTTTELQKTLQALGS